MNLQEAILVFRNKSEAEEILTEYFKNNINNKLIELNLGATSDCSISDIDDNFIYVTYYWYGPYQSEDVWTEKIPIEILTDVELGCKLYMNQKVKETEEKNQKLILEAAEREERRKKLYLELKKEYEL